MEEDGVDSQLVELAGRNWLTYQLLSAGLEVARPERDRGIDLIVYLDVADWLSEFVACSIQMKASTNRDFSIYAKYERFPGLLLAYVWCLGDPAKTHSYALTYAEALRIADLKGYTESPTWKNKRQYNNTRPGAELLAHLEPYRMSPERWRAKVMACLESGFRCSSEGELSP